MRRFISSNALVFQRLDTLELKQLETDKMMEKVLNAFGGKFESSFIQFFIGICEGNRKGKFERIMVILYEQNSANFALRMNTSCSS